MIGPDFLLVFTDQNSSTPTATTMPPSVTLTTILIPSLQPEYEKLPTLKPISDSLEKTTMMATPATTNAPLTTSYTVVNNQTLLNQLSSVMTETSAPKTTTTESVEKLTTDFKIGESHSMHHLF